MEGLTLTKVEKKNGLPEKYRTLGNRKDETWTNPCKKKKGENNKWPNVYSPVGNLVII